MLPLRQIPRAVEERPGPEPPRSLPRPQAAIRLHRPRPGPSSPRVHARVPKRVAVMSTVARSGRTAAHRQARDSCERARWLGQERWRSPRLRPKSRGKRGNPFGESMVTPGFRSIGPSRSSSFRAPNAVSGAAADTMHRGGPIHFCQGQGFGEGFGEALAWLLDSIPIAAGRASFDRASIRTVGYVHSRALCWLGSCLAGAAFSESACGRMLSPPSAARPTRAVTVTRSRLLWLLPFRSHPIFPFPSFNRNLLAARCPAGRACQKNNPNRAAALAALAAIAGAAHFPRRVAEPGFRFAPPMGYDPAPLGGSKALSATERAPSGQDWG